VHSEPAISIPLSLRVNLWQEHPGHIVLGRQKSGASRADRLRAEPISRMERVGTLLGCKTEMRRTVSVLGFAVLAVLFAALIALGISSDLFGVLALGPVARSRPLVVEEGRDVSQVPIVEEQRDVEKQTVAPPTPRRTKRVAAVKRALPPPSAPEAPSSALLPPLPAPSVGVAALVPP
jgi:hypothetical protein